MNISEKIKHIRKKKKLNTSQFGELIMKSGRTIENYEQGRREPDALAVREIEKIFEAL